MIFLILAILSSALVSLVMRLSTGKVKYNIGMLAVNYFVCMLSAFFYTDSFSLFPDNASLSTTLALGGINGILYLVSFVFLQYNTKKNGVVLSAVFMKLGLLVPLAISVAFFGEKPTALQFVGFALAIAAIIMINAQGTSGGKIGSASLILLLITGGSAEAMSKVYEEVGDSSLSAQFLLYTFAAAFVLCITFMLLKKQRIGKSEIFYGILIGVPNFFSAKFMLRALADIPAVIAFPSFSVATILVVSLVGVIAFKEKLSKLQWAAVGIIIATLAILNI